MSVCGQASVFVSHSYDYKILKLVDALEAWEARQAAEVKESRTIYYFVDLLVVKQHDEPTEAATACGSGAAAAPSQISHDVLLKCFADGVAGTQHVLFCLDWHKPSSFGRAWCVFEVCAAMRAGLQLEVIMAPEDEAAFCAAMIDDVAALALEIVHHPQRSQ